MLPCWKRAFGNLQTAQNYLHDRQNTAAQPNDWKDCFAYECKYCGKCHVGHPPKKSKGKKGRLATQKPLSAEIRIVS